MDPTTIGALAKFGSSAAQALAGGPSSASGYTDARAFMDGAGWTVSTGGSRAVGATVTRSGDPFGASTGTSPALSNLASIDPTVLVGVAALLVLVLLLKRR